MPRQGSHPTTTQCILDAAERLFAEKGLRGASMRDITDAAGVNLAAVNYHFGSKEGLISAVFHRHLAPLTEARLAMLDEVEAAAGGSPPVLEAILEAHIRPAVVRALEPAYDNETFSLLMGRCLSEPDIQAKYVYPHFKPVIERFGAAVARAVPGLSREEIFWRMSFMSGGLHLTIQMWSKPQIAVFEVGKPLDAERFIRNLVAFAAAGLRSIPPDD